MDNYISEDHHKAVTLMGEARKILFTALHESVEARKILAEGLDKLGLAFEFVENPLGEVALCPECECFCLEKMADGMTRCLSCDTEWSERKGEDHAEH